MELTATVIDTGNVPIGDTLRSAILGLRADVGECGQAKGGHRSESVGAVNSHFEMTVNQHECVPKVAAFITRDAAAGSQILVFRHPTAGIQVPAGTVEEHETWRQAVVREIREETGLEHVSVVRRLARMTEQLAPQRAVLNRTIPAARAGQQSDHRLSATRGQIVSVVRNEGAKVLVSQDEYGMVDGRLVVASSTVGWVPAGALSPGIERHLVHLRSDESAGSSWSLKSDRGHTFEVRWAFIADVALVESQASWLRSVYNELNVRRNFQSHRWRS